MRCTRRLAVALSPLAVLAASPALAYDWLQYNGNAQHSGNNTLETTIGRSNVAQLAQKFQVTLPAIADGAPVFLEGVATAGGVKDLIFVTTRGGDIQARDAKSGALVWGMAFGPGTCKINNGANTCYTTSSPAIDPNRAYVYTYGLDGYVHKLAVGDGTETKTGGWPALATLKGYDEKGSSALSTATTGGTTYLYVVHGGYPGDGGDYQGHVTAINLATGAQKVFNAACSDKTVHLDHYVSTVTATTCAQRQNAIWGRPGVVYDAGTNRLFLATGNAFTAGAGRFDGVHNWSETAFALNPDGSGAVDKPVDSYTPANWSALDDADADIGSTSMAILPVPANSNVQHLGVLGGKDQKLRLINLANMSGLNGPGHTGGHIGALVSLPNANVVLSQPAAWVNPADGTTWVFVVNGSGAAAYRLAVDGSGNPSLALQWNNGNAGFSPLVANNILYILGSNIIRAVDPASGATLWSSTAVGGLHWQSPIVANGVLYATDQSSRLTAFAPPPPPTVNLAVSAGGGQGAQVNSPFANPVKVLVTDGSGTPIPNATVAWAAPTIGASAALAASVTLTDPGGVASNTLTSNAISGTYTITAQNSGQSVAIPLTNTLGVSVGGGCINPNPTVSDLIEQDYAAILRRGSDAGGKTYWSGEAYRLCTLGVDPKQNFIVLGNVFLTSAEYSGLGRSDSAFVTDLYVAFLNRAPDGGGLAYWTGQLAQGMPRSIVANSFLFAPEFSTAMQQVFGTAPSRAEVYTVMNLYGGLLHRLPDSGGFTYWVEQMRAAQCVSAAAVAQVIDQITSQFIGSAEYAGLNRTDSGFVQDLYYAMLQRGGDLAGFNFWVTQRANGTLTRAQVRQQFLAASEMQAQINAVAAQGCAP
jgi:hypothetical protein